VNKKNGGTVINTFLNSLIDIENAFGSGEYLLADSLINTTNDSTYFEQNFIKVYSILLPFRYPVIAPLDSVAIDSLNTIAIQNPQTAGPAVYAARAILWQENNMQFVDNEKDHEPGLTAKIMFENCLPSLPADLTIQLMDMNNTLYNTPIQLFSDGTVYIAPEDIALLDQGFQYTFVLNYPFTSPTLVINEWIYGNNNLINICALGKTTNIVKLKETETVNKFSSFYPNPAKNELLFSLPNEENYQIEIVDLLGKVYVSSTVSNANKQISISALSGGMYIVKIKDHNGITVLTNKLLVDK